MLDSVVLITAILLSSFWRGIDGNCPQPLNAIACSNTAHGDICTRSCLVGYSGESTPIICTSTNTWWPTTVQPCASIQCPITPTFYAETCSNRNYADNCTLSCDSGYYAARSILICNAKGVWTPPTSCSKVSCNDPPTSNSISCGGNVYKNSMCSVKCNVGYYSTIDFITCNVDGNSATGNWSEIPQCKKSICPPSPPSSANSCPNFYNGNTCKFTCEEGYYSPVKSITCKVDDGKAIGNWNPMNAECTRISCPSQPLLNANICVNKNFGSKCTFTCKEGYHSTSKQVIVCVSNGESHIGRWEPNNIFCKYDLELTTVRDKFVVLKGHKTLTLTADVKTYNVTILSFEETITGPTGKIIQSNLYETNPPLEKRLEYEMKDLSEVDAGEYIFAVQVKTKLHIYRSDVKITVHVHVPATISLDYDVVAITRNQSNVEFVTCRSYGIPHPKVAWYQIANNTNEELSGDVTLNVYQSSTSITSNGFVERKLVVEKADTNDIGTYTCDSTNSIGIYSVMISVNTTTDIKEMLDCTKIPSHGKLDITCDDSSDSTACHFTCKGGLNLIGNSTVICHKQNNSKFDGKWEDLPYCEMSSTIDMTYFIVVCAVAGLLLVGLLSLLILGFNKRQSPGDATPAVSYNSKSNNADISNIDTHPQHRDSFQSEDEYDTRKEAAYCVPTPVAIFPKHYENMPIGNAYN